VSKLRPLDKLRVVPSRSRGDKLRVVLSALKDEHIEKERLFSVNLVSSVVESRSL
jgi:hypothetical protein